MPINSRNKGATFERFVVNAFKGAGYLAVRTAPMQAGHPKSFADVEVRSGENGRLLFAVECKAWKEQPSDNAVEAAFRQAVESADITEGVLPLVVYKQNARSPKVVYAPGDDARISPNGLVTTSLEAFLAGAIPW